MSKSGCFSGWERVTSPPPGSRQVQVIICRIGHAFRSVCVRVISPRVQETGGPGERVPGIGSSRHQRVAEVTRWEKIECAPRSSTEWGNYIIKVINRGLRWRQRHATWCWQQLLEPSSREGQSWCRQQEVFVAHKRGSAAVVAPASVQQQAGESVTGSLSLLL